MGSLFVAPSSSLAVRHEKAAAALLAFEQSEEDALAIKKFSDKERRRLEEQAKYLARWKLQISAMHDALIRLNEKELLVRLLSTARETPQSPSLLGTCSGADS